MSRGERKAMVRRDIPGLGLSQQCQVLSISRSSFYYTPKGESAENLALMVADGWALAYRKYSMDYVRHDNTWNIMRGM